MKIALTVKMVPAPGELFHPHDVMAVMEGYTKVRDAGTLGQPELVSLRFIIEGHGKVNAVEVPEVQEEPHVPEAKIPVIE